MNSPLAESLQRLGVSEKLQGVAIGLESRDGRGESLTVHSPIDGCLLAEFSCASPDDVTDAVSAADHAFRHWRTIPAPHRGEFVRRLGLVLRENQHDLATVVSWEAGKIVSEARGEVQEMIDICDFAVGLSRQLYGLTIASERPGHRLMEQWHPLGPVGVITAFNFPVAVWAWNAALALVCGDPVIWKPSEKTPLTALACHALATQVSAGNARSSPGAAHRSHRSERCRRSALRCDTSSAHLRDRFCSDGTRGGRSGCVATRKNAARTGRKQRNDRRTVRRSRSNGPFDRVRCRGNLRTALHESAPLDRPRIDPQRTTRASQQTIYERLPIGNPLELEHARRSADRRSSRSRNASGADTRLANCGCEYLLR